MDKQKLEELYVIRRLQGQIPSTMKTYYNPRDQQLHYVTGPMNLEEWLKYVEHENEFIIE